MMDGHGRYEQEGGDVVGISIWDESRVSATGPLKSRRGVAKLIVDSPRILARDDRAAHFAAEAEPPR
jgi:hypothetical protein